MKLAFILDPLEGLKAYKDSSVAMMREAARRGHEIWAVRREALTWRDGEGRYFCGMVLTPAAHLRWLPPLLQAPAGRLCRRWIATGSGCDFDAEVSAVIRVSPIGRDSTG